MPGWVTVARALAPAAAVSAVVVSVVAAIIGPALFQFKYLAYIR